MEIILGKTAGFCAGVTNAIQKTEEVLKEKETVFCLGELVHNGQVMDKLKQKGLLVIDSIKQASNNCHLIIRAHGVPPEVYHQAREKNISVIDLTCPKVLTIHEKVSNYKEKGYYIFLIGMREHPEVIGTHGFCGENTTIIEQETEIETAIKNFKKSNLEKIVIVSQTTFSMKKWEELVDKIKQELENVEILVDNTICNATSTRQKETEDISKIVDSMLIIGGKNSSNTKKLFELSSKNCQNVQMIETVEELKKDKLEKSFKVGIMAGASTPKESIVEVIQELEKMK